MEEVKIIKMVSSEEVIAFFVGEDEKVVRIKKPFTIGPNHTGNGLAVFPWSVCSIRPEEDEVFEIYKTSITMVHKAPKELADSYYEKTSGLVIPTELDKQLICG